MGDQKKVHMNMAVIGHVGSGKSTATGHLISELGGTDEGAISRLEEEAAEIDKMHLVDILKSERERGITSLWKFETNKYDFTVIDPPGHADFIQSMIGGTFWADCAVLIIDSITAIGCGVERGLSIRGQTCHHAFNAYTLGVEHIICCCNKMDATTPKYSRGRYEEIVKQMSSYLKALGYSPDKITFVPISASEGDNMTERSAILDNWYEGPTLLEALDDLNEPKRPLDMPRLRLHAFAGPPWNF